MALFIRALYWLWFQIDGTDTSLLLPVQCKCRIQQIYYFFRDWNMQARELEDGLSLVRLQYMVGGFQQTCPQMDPISVLQCYSATCSWGNLRRLTCKQGRKMGHTISTRDHATTLKGKDCASSFWFGIVIDYQWLIITICCRNWSSSASLISSCFSS